jgi:hypothetical protein
MAKPEGKTPLGRPRHRWEENITMYLQEVVWGINWIDVAQDRKRCRALVNVVMTSGFHKLRVISRLAEELLASQGGL